MNNTTVPVIMPIVAGTDPLILYWPSDAPITNPSLTANLVCRVLFGLIGCIVCLVPLRLLHKNGEFAAVVFITTVVGKNLITILNALIWRNNDVENWWPGYGLCDVMPYIQHFIVMLYVTCLLAIVRNLAHQVGLLRANTLTAKEKWRRNLVQGLIMFPFPLLQAALTWFLTSQRFVVGTLVGCSWTGSPNWVYLVFFILPPLVGALITAGYAILTYVRFRELSKSTGEALSSNRRASDRAQRTRRRLYLMVVAILVPFLPVVTALAVLNILDLKKLEPYSYDAIHHHTEPYPWNTIVYLRSEDLGFAYMNVAWIPILSTIPIFVFFGTTKDAMNDYRRLLLFFGLGKIFPRLYQEYDPDRRGGDSSNGSSSNGSSGVASTESRFGKSPHAISLTTSFRMLSKKASSAGESTVHELQSIDRIASNDLESGHTQPAPPSNPLGHSSKDTVEIPHRNPWLMRTNLNFPTIPFPFSRKPKEEHIDSPSQVSLNNLGSHPGRASPPIRTRVWHEEEGSARANYDHEDETADARSVASARGVVIETHVVRELHPSDGQR